MRISRFPGLFAIAAAVMAIGSGHATTGIAADAKITAGWTERVRILPTGLRLMAKLDTGADNSSLNVSTIRMFEKRGKRWVTVRVENREGKSIDLELPVKRIARIKNLDGESLRRPTITLGICLGSIYREVDVNLTKRKGFKFNMLIGRSFMEGRLVVDSSRTYLTEPNCPELARVK